MTLFVSIPLFLDCRTRSLRCTAERTPALESQRNFEEKSRGRGLYKMIFFIKKGSYIIQDIDDNIEICDMWVTGKTFEDLEFVG